MFTRVETDDLHLRISESKSFQNPSTPFNILAGVKTIFQFLLSFFPVLEGLGYITIEISHVLISVRFVSSVSLVLWRHFTDLLTLSWMVTKIRRYLESSFLLTIQLISWFGEFNSACLLLYFVSLHISQCQILFPYHGWRFWSFRWEFPSFVVFWGWGVLQ